jgi:hypothetical protein
VKVARYSGAAGVCGAGGENGGNGTNPALRVSTCANAPMARRVGQRGSGIVVSRDERTFVRMFVLSGVSPTDRNSHVDAIEAVISSGKEIPLSSRMLHHAGLP